MQLQIQPSRWSCLPTAVAMVLGVPVDLILHKIGHDGSEILWPELDEPGNRRSFHVQEMIDVIINHPTKHQVTVIEKTPMLVIQPESVLDAIADAIDEKSWQKIEPAFDKLRARVIPLINNQTRYEQYLTKYTGVVLGNKHAVAWNPFEGKVYDPAIGHLYDSTATIMAKMSEMFLIISRM